MKERRVLNARFAIDNDLERRVLGRVACPLGVYPIDTDASLDEGYESRYVTGEGEFGDTFEFRILVSAERTAKLARFLFEELLPDEVYPVYEEFSFDAYRDTDAFMSDEPAARERFLAAWDVFGPFFIEDGKCGFGAVSFEPPMEIVVEEHGSIFISVSPTHKARVEELIEKLRLPAYEALKCIDNFRHQHQDVLQIDADGQLMDEVDVKFAVLETFGMKASNQEEGENVPSPALFWIECELDTTFCKRPARAPRSLSIGVTADDHDDAQRLLDEMVLEVPGALLARVVHHYRITEEDLNADIAPKKRDVLAVRGVWFKAQQ